MTCGCVLVCVFFLFFFDFLRLSRLPFSLSLGKRKECCAGASAGCFNFFYCAIVGRYNKQILHCCLNSKESNLCIDRIETDREREERALYLHQGEFPSIFLVYS